MTARRPSSFARGGRAAPARLPALALAAALLPAAAQAQMLRGAFDALPGQDEEFSPYALGAPFEPAFEPMPDFDPGAFERSGAGPTPLVPPGAPPRRLPKRAVEEDPYEQLGIRAGTFLVKPGVELYGGYDTNPLSMKDEPRGSSFARGESRLDVESDWSRHAFRGRLEAGYRAYDEFPELDAPDYSADAALRLDARRDLRLDFAARAAVTSETRGDPEFAGISGISRNERIGASAGFVWKPDRVSVGMTGEADRRTFDDFEDRNYNAYEIRLRTGYELSPGLEPFVEVSGNQRIYDEERNDAGILHDSQGLRGYGGVRFEPDPVWAVEGKLGYGVQEAEDDSIPNLDGVVAQASVIWTPSALTRIRFTAERDFEASTSECCAMAERWRASAELEHEFRRWLILTGDFGFEESRYELIDETVRNYDAELALEYKFNRTLSAIGRARYERQDSTDSDDDYQAGIFEVGLRVQR